MKVKKTLSTVQITLLGFALIIVLGTLLLMLPISSYNEENRTFSVALFTATTSTCVTGLVVVPTSSWSFFGQAVILMLIQIGGLGFVTVMSGLLISLHRTFGYSKKILIQESVNLNSLSGIINFIKKVIIGTFIVEAVGALLYMLVFIPQFGIKGVWISVFSSVSAFCNAGMDIIGDNSLCNYITNPLINFVTMTLIVLGGLGYVIWWDIIRVIKCGIKRKNGVFKNLTLHSKIAIASTAVLIFTGMFLFFVFEYTNPKTFGSLSLMQKINASLFQSVTTRTAGFATVPQENLTTASSVVSMLLMFIGGSPTGTAGGVKTVTFAVLMLSAISVINGKNDVEVCNRQIKKDAVSKSIAIVFVSVSVILTSTILLSAISDKTLEDVLYETISAAGTVGLSKNLTPYLSLAGRYIIIATMYLGRVGPITLALSFKFNKENKNLIKVPTEEISVG